MLAVNNVIAVVCWYNLSGGDHIMEVWNQFCESVIEHADFLGIEPSKLYILLNHFLYFTTRGGIMCYKQIGDIFSMVIQIIIQKTDFLRYTSLSVKFSNSRFRIGFCYGL